MAPTTGDSLRKRRHVPKRLPAAWPRQESAARVGAWPQVLRQPPVGTQRHERGGAVCDAAASPVAAKQAAAGRLLPHVLAGQRGDAVVLNTQLWRGRLHMGGGGGAGAST